MKLTFGQLKRLIKEALSPSPEQRARKIVDATSDAAEHVVDSLVAGHLDKNAATELKQLSDQAEQIARFLQNHKTPASPYVVRFAQLAQDIAKNVSFWARPTFLKRDEYVQDMKTKVKNLQNAQLAISSRLN